jgi:hypothetical protein
MMPKRPFLGGLGSVPISRVRLTPEWNACGLVVPPHGVGIEQVSAIPREDHTALVAAKVDGLDEVIVAEMIESIVVRVGPVRARHRRCRSRPAYGTAVLAIQLVHTVFIPT